MCSMYIFLQTQQKKGCQIKDTSFFESGTKNGKAVGKCVSTEQNGYNSNSNAYHKKCILQLCTLRALQMLRLFCFFIHIFLVLLSSRRYIFLQREELKNDLECYFLVKQVPFKISFYTFLSLPSYYESAYKSTHVFPIILKP